MRKPQIDHEEECVLLAILEGYPISIPEDRIVARAQELSELLSANYAKEKNRIIANKAMLLSVN